MLQRGHRLRLAHEPRPKHRIMRKLSWQHLDRHIPLKSRIMTEEDSGHPATAYLTKDAVLTDILPMDTNWLSF